MSTFTDLSLENLQPFSIKFNTAVLSNCSLALIKNSSSASGISPKSTLNDGLLEVCIIKPLAWYKFPLLAYEMLMSKTHRSKFVEIISGKRISIVRIKENSIHIDGEPFFMGKQIEIEIIPSALNVITAV